MMRNRFDRQLTELNQDMIQMGHRLARQAAWQSAH